MSNSNDGQIDQLVKARWLALGLSPHDLAEVLGPVDDALTKTLNGPGHGNARHLMQVADSLGVSHDLFQGLAPVVRQKRAIDGDAIDALLELRLLRVFRDVQNPNTRRMLIQLVERIVKRQTALPDDAG
jgi:hypothetical protein